MQYERSGTIEANEYRPAGIADACWRIRTGGEDGLADLHVRPVTPARWQVNRYWQGPRRRFTRAGCPGGASGDTERTGETGYRSIFLNVM